jgi:hypothetical protein
MKDTRLTSILNSSLVACALTIASLASTQLASAQMEPVLAEVNIPFAFQTPTRTLPAGVYRIHRKSDHLIRLEGPGSARGFVLTYDIVESHASNRGVIVFDRYGDKYFLHQIWTARRSTESLSSTIPSHFADPLPIVLVSWFDAVS